MISGETHQTILSTTNLAAYLCGLSNCIKHYQKHQNVLEY